jgi:hypothetical protein
VGKASASKLDDWQALWAENRRLFLEKWSGDTEIPRLDGCDPDTFARNRAIAASVAEWMAKYFKARDKAQALEPALLKARDQVRDLQADLDASRAREAELRRTVEAAKVAKAAPPKAAPPKATPERPPSRTAGSRVRAEARRNLRRLRRRMPPRLKAPTLAALDRLPAGLGDRVRRAAREQGPGGSRSRGSRVA